MSGIRPIVDTLRHLEDGCFRGAHEAAHMAYAVADAMLKVRES